MASESPAERWAALRALLVEHAAEQSPPGRRSSGRPRATEPGSLRTLLVTGVVAVAVVAASIVTLQLTRPSPPTAAPAATAAVPTASPTGFARTPTETPTRSLIAPTGWQERTREELHAFVAGSSMLQQDPANAAIWEEQAWLDIRCMADHGYVFDPVAEQRGGAAAAGNGLTAAQLAEFQVLMYGPRSSAPYDWRTAGCHGRSVHETGQDHAN